jgi:hypothetical protein
LAGQNTGWPFWLGFSNARRLTRLSLLAMGRLVQFSGVAQRDAMKGKGHAIGRVAVSAVTHGGVAPALAPSMLWASPKRWSPAPHRPQAPQARETAPPAARPPSADAGLWCPPSHNGTLHTTHLALMAPRGPRGIRTLSRAFQADHDRSYQESPP